LALPKKARSLLGSRNCAYQYLTNTGSLDYYQIGDSIVILTAPVFPGIRNVFRFHKDNEAYYRDSHADCDAVVLVGEHWGGQGKGYMLEFSGLYRVLTETHQFFDGMVLPRVKELGMAKYRHAILPNLAELDGETALILDEFVVSGNTLLVTGTPPRRERRAWNGTKISTRRPFREISPPPADEMMNHVSSAWASEP